MPLYEYQCKKCNRKFETLVSTSKTNDQVECPSCGSDETTKLLSSFCASVGAKNTSNKSSCSPKGG
jgi:putative FmdB family regulatory protein